MLIKILQSLNSVVNIYMYMCVCLAFMQSNETFVCSNLAPSCGSCHNELFEQWLLIHTRFGLVLGK